MSVFTSGTLNNLLKRKSNLHNKGLEAKNALEKLYSTKRNAEYILRTGGFFAKMKARSSLMGLNKKIANLEAKVKALNKEGMNAKKAYNNAARANRIARGASIPGNLL